MATDSARGRKSATTRFLEELGGGPLSLAELLRSIRLGEGWSQAEMARRLGLSRQNLCDLEKGRAQASPERVARYAEILGYPQTQFVRLALQDQVARAGLRMIVQVAAG